MHLPPVVGMVHSLLFFIVSISCALGLHQFYSVRSNKYKDKDDGGGPDIPPHPMETDSVTTWQQDSIVVSRDEAVVGTPQRRSSRQAAHKANKTMKSQILPEGGSGKSSVGGAPKRQAIGSPQVGEFESANVLYLPGSETEN